MSAVALPRSHQLSLNERLCHPNIGQTLKIFRACVRIAIASLIADSALGQQRRSVLRVQTPKGEGDLTVEVSYY
jgi:hypothetical protein